MSMSMKVENGKPHISTREAAHILGISETSVRNWIKHGYLQPVKNDCFVYAQVMELKVSITAGTIPRLNRRANKSQSSKTFLPAELMLNKRDKAKLTRVICYILDWKIHPEAALFMLAINLLQKKNILPRSIPVCRIRSGDFSFPGTHNLLKDLALWHRSIPGNAITAKALGLLDFELAEQQDLLGIIYQSITGEGIKAAQGSYYTPYPVVEQIAREYGEEGACFLDPCCGTGQFLLAFSKYINNPAGLYGIDLDRTAVWIARINLYLQFPDSDFAPALYCGDALQGDWKFPLFDVIATNPPWGYHYTAGMIGNLEALYPDIHSGESFSFFLKRGIDWLGKKGKLIYLLPESILNVKTHEDIREYILTKSRLCGIQYLKQGFTNVFSPVVVLSLDKQQRKKKIIVRKKQGSPFKIDCSRFAANPGKIFDVHMEYTDQDIIARVYSKEHITLKDNAEWALGIVTGNNGKYVQAVKQGASWEPVYKGRDIKPFSFSPPSAYIRFEPHLFQQVAPREKYRVKEKLVYKFISHRLVFAYDTEQRLTLNSANILIPGLPGYPCKVILGLFNSLLYQYIFQKKFNTIKVLRSHLEALPLPVLQAETTKQIVHRVDRIIGGEDIIDALDELIFALFAIGKNEQEYIRKNVK